MALAALQGTDPLAQLLAAHDRRPNPDALQALVSLFQRQQQTPADVVSRIPMASALLPLMGGGMQFGSTAEAPPLSAEQSKQGVAQQAQFNPIADVAGLIAGSAVHPTGRAVLSSERGAVGEAPLVVYHGGKDKIAAVDPSKLGSRDYGFYGEGFYVTEAPHYAKAYGPRVSAFKVAPDAKVLRSELTPEKAPSDLVDAVVNWKRETGAAKAVARGKSSQFEDELHMIRTNPLAWKNAVDEYGTAHGYDVIRHSAGEIVVKNPAVLTPR